MGLGWKVQCYTVEHDARPLRATVCHRGPSVSSRRPFHALDPPNPTRCSLVFDAKHRILRVMKRSAEAIEVIRVRGYGVGGVGDR